MADWIESSISLLSDRSIHLSYRLAMALLALTILFAINDLGGFYRNYTINRRIEQLKNLKEIDSTLLSNSDVKKELQRVTFRVTHEQSYLRNIWLQLSTPGKHVIANDKKETGDSVRSGWWFTITAMLFPYLFIALVVLVGLPYTLFYAKETGNGKVTVIVGMLIMIAAAYWYGLLYRWAISFVPLFSGRFWINYIINVSGQLFIILPFWWLINKYTKKQGTV